MYTHRTFENRDNRNAGPKPRQKPPTLHNFSDLNPNTGHIQSFRSLTSLTAVLSYFHLSTVPSNALITNEQKRGNTQL